MAEESTARHCRDQEQKLCICPKVTTAFLFLFEKIRIRFWSFQKRLYA